MEECRGSLLRVPKIEGRTYNIFFFKRKGSNKFLQILKGVLDPIKVKKQDKAKSHGLGFKRPALCPGPTTNQPCHCGKVLMALGISSETWGNWTSLGRLCFVLLAVEPLSPKKTSRWSKQRCCGWEGSEVLCSFLLLSLHHLYPTLPFCPDSLPGSSKDQFHHWPNTT